MTDNTSILFTSLLVASLATAVSMTNVSAEPAPPSIQSNPATLPASPPQESATSPQQRGISPDQPLKSKIRYECKNDNQKLSTVAHTERGTIELIVWESTYLEPIGLPPNAVPPSPSDCKRSRINAYSALSLQGV